MKSMFPTTGNYDNIAVQYSGFTRTVDDRVGEPCQKNQKIANRGHRALLEFGCWHAVCGFILRSQACDDLTLLDGILTQFL